MVHRIAQKSLKLIFESTPECSKLLCNYVGTPNLVIKSLLIILLYIFKFFHRLKQKGHREVLYSQPRAEEAH